MYSIGYTRITASQPAHFRPIQQTGQMFQIERVGDGGCMQPHVASGPAVVPRHRIHRSTSPGSAGGVFLQRNVRSRSPGKIIACRLPCKRGIYSTVTPDILCTPAQTQATPLAHRHHAGTTPASCPPCPPRPPPFPRMSPLDRRLCQRLPPATESLAVPDSPVHNGPPRNPFICSAAIHHLLQPKQGRVFLLLRAQAA